MHISFSIFMKLVIDAKLRGKGSKGNSYILIKFLELFTDRKFSGIERTWRTIQKLSRNIALPAEFYKNEFSADTIAERLLREDEIREAYAMLRNFMTPFLKSGRNYPYDAISLNDFEKSLHLYGRKPSWELYKAYLSEIGNICDEILDNSMKKALIYTLLEILHQDKQLEFLFYGNRFIRKSELLGTYAHPKYICAEALLLGLLYHVHKQPNQANTGSYQLTDLPERSPVRIVFLGNQDSNIFWLNPDEFQKRFCQEFESEHALNLEKSIAENSHLSYAVQGFQQIKEFYPPELLTESGEIILFDNFIKSENKNIFLYASGGMGKTSLLLEKLKSEQNKICFLIPLCLYQSHEKSWILLYILLKYYYQNEYSSYAECSACEGETALLQQIRELKKLLTYHSENFQPEYLLLLDGMNEINPELQDDFIEELASVCENWHNVRVILSSRTVSKHEVFKQFEKFEILGIPDTVRDNLSAVSPEALKNQELLEILKTPLFLNMYLKNADAETPLCTRGEILDAYFMNQIKKYDKPLQFVIKYALPILIKRHIQKFQGTSVSAFQILWNWVEHHFKRSDISDAVEEAFQIYVKDEHIWQNLTSDDGFRRKSLLEAKESADFTELLIESTGILTVMGNHLQFSHEYIYDYFTAKYFHNMLNTAIQIGNFTNFELKSAYWVCSETPYVLLSEICGDYRNIPDKNGFLDYHRTLLDDILDMARKFHSNQIANFILRVMRFSRNGLICNVDFSHLFISGFQLNGLKFSNNGDYPSNFQECRTEYLSNNASAVFCADFSPDGKKLLLGMDDSHVILFDIRAGRILKNYNLHAYLKYPECFQSIKFLNSYQFTVSTESTKFLIETESGTILHIEHKTCSFRYSVRTVAISADYQHFLIDDMLYSVTGERKKIQFPERYNHFKNCDFHNFSSLFDYDKNKEILRKSGAIIE